MAMLSGNIRLVVIVAGAFLFLPSLILGVFAVAVGTVILPSLSRDFARSDESLFAAKLDWALRVMLLLSVPAALALIAKQQAAPHS